MQKGENVMANNCYFDMKVIGSKRNIKIFYEALPAYTDKDLTIAAQDLNADEDKIIEAYICGDCRWSIYSSMVDKERGYFLPAKTKELRLKVEVFSEESGMGFQEHFVFNQGTIEISEWEDYAEYWLGDFETKEQAEEELETKILDVEWQKQLVVRGGFDNWNFTI